LRFESEVEAEFIEIDDSYGPLLWEKVYG
jgi:hypothetical protein